MHFLASLALCALVLAATLRFLAPALLHLFLFPPHLRLSHLTFSSIRGVRFTTRHGVRIEVDCVSLARPKGDEGDRGAWAVLRVEGVNVVVPLEALSRSPAPKPKPKGKRASYPPPPSPAHDKPAPPHPPPPRRRPHPLLALATRLVPHLAHRLVLRVAPVRISLGAGDKGDDPRPTLELSLVAGVSSTHRPAHAHPQPRSRPHPHSRPRAHSHPLEHALGVHELSAWVRIAGVSLADAPLSPSRAPEHEQHKPALELAGALELRVALELARGRWEPREGGLEVTLEPLGGRCSGAAAEELEGGTCGSVDDVDEWGVREKRREGGRPGRGPERRARDEDEAHEGALLLRVQELECLLERFKHALGAAKAQQAPPPPPGQAEQHDDGVDAAAASAQRAKAARSRRILRLLGSVDLALPPVVLAARYVAPSSARSSSSPSSAAPIDAGAADGKACPSTMALALAVRGARVQLRRGAARKEHEGWIAQGEEAWSAGAEWGEVEGRVRMGQLEDEPQDELLTGPTATKALSLGASRIDLSSTWLPSSFSAPPSPPTSTSAAATSLAAPSTAPPLNHNDTLVVLEGLLGPMRAHSAFESLAAAVRIVHARPAHSHGVRAAAPSRRASSPPSPPSAEEPASRRLYGLPRVVGALTLSGVELRLQGPVLASSEPDPARLAAPDPDDPFFRSWASPELLCVSAPRVRCAFGGQWEERSVRRSEVERRAADRARRHHRGVERERAKRDSQRDEERERSRSRTRAQEGVREERPGMHRTATSALEDELGVPPPPPLSEDYSRRRIKPLKVAPNLTKDLDKYSLEYATRLSVTADTLNVFILASNHEEHEHDSASAYDSDDSTASAASTAASDERDARHPRSRRRSTYGMPALPSDPIRLDILALGPLELTSAVRALGDETPDRAQLVPWVDAATCRGEHGVLLETIQVDLWRPVVLGCVGDLAAALLASRRPSTSPSSFADADPAARPPPAIRPLVDLLPADQNLYIALASFNLRIAGADPKADPHSCRGVAVHTGPLVLQYLMQSAHEPGSAGDYAARAALRLAEDVRIEANASANPSTPGLGPPPVALAKVSLHGWSIDPVVDARASRGRRRRGVGKRGEGHVGGNAQGAGDEHVGHGPDWELRGRADLAELVGRRKSIIQPWRGRTPEEREAGRGLVVVPEISVRLRIQRAAPAEVVAGDIDHGDEPKKGDEAPLDDIAIMVESRLATMRIELFSIYLCLMAISSLRSLGPTSTVNTPDREGADAATTASSASPRRRPRPLLRASGEIKDLHLFPTLPHDTHLFVNFHRILFSHSAASGLTLSFEKAILAGQSPTVSGKWEDIVSLRKSEFCMRPDSQNQGYHPFVLSLSSETARLRIPFRYVFSRIVDNTASLVKATKQLVYEHVKGGTRVIIEPGPEQAKRLPQIELRVGLFALELQDDPFETKLNIIWRAGYEEQLARIERRKAFEDKVEAIRRAEAAGKGGDVASAPDDEDDEDSEDDQSFAASAKPKVSARHTVGVDEAERALRKYNSSHWVKRIRNASAEQARREEALTRRLYGVADRNVTANKRLPIELLPVSKSAPLARGTFHDLSFVVSKPSFGGAEGDDEGLKDFLHDVGKGLPRDTVFSLLVPVHFSWTMTEARFQLRDYPLPLLHVPRSGRPEQPSWTCESDLVVGEEVGGLESVRRVPCAIIPQHVFEGQGAPYAIVVPRSAMPTKTYASPVIQIRSADPLRFGWGNSMQPAIQDVARVFDTLTKASPDPSERIGFWDKIRLQLHWRIRLVCPGPSASVIFHLKGSRDPYALTGFGAGFAKAWKGNVELRLGHDNPDYEFFQVSSDKYVLGIPNLREYIDSAATGSFSTDSLDSERTSSEAGDAQSAGGSAYAASTLGNGDDDLDLDQAGSDSASDTSGDEDDIEYWLKVCAKCINGVRWGMAVRLEHTCRDGECDKPSCAGLPTFHRQCRRFEFIPHWQVHTKTSAAIGPLGEIVDSFAGFRSDFIHFSLSLTSPANLALPNRDQEADDADVQYSGKNGYNSFHFSPHAMTHFHRWWKLFDGCMSLPVRQGRLFPSVQAPSPKFGRHTATIKYRFSLAPLFISHTYRQETWAEWERGETTVLGMKGKIGRFNVDLHQRTQEMVIRRPEMSESKTVKHKAFYMAEIDLDGLDLRTITAVFAEPLKADVAPADANADDEASTPIPSYDDDYTVRPEDREWVNLNDFHDSMYTMPVDDGLDGPRLRIMPFMVCPRFTYYRHKDSAPTKDGDDESADGHEASTPPEKPKTKFGNELSHTCLMGRATDTVTVHIEEAEERLRELKSQLAASRSATLTGEIELRIKAVESVIERLRQIRDEAQPSSLPDHVEANHHEQQQRHEHDPHSSAHPHQYQHRPPPTPSSGVHEDSCDTSAFPHLTNTLYEEWGQWENRYMVHSPTVQVSNATREVLLKYYYSHRDRKGFLYHASANVLRFIRDLAKQHERNTKRDNMSRRKSTRTGTAGGSMSAKRNGPFHDSDETNRLLDDLIQKGSTWAANEEDEADDGRHRFGDHLDVDPYAAAEALPEAYDATSGHLCVFTKPQVSLQSDVDDKSTLVIAAFRAQVKVFEIIDTRVVDDPVNAEVLNQTFARLDGLQVFYPRQQVARADRKFAQSFVPLETLVDLRVEPWGFDRVVSRTSAAMRYDKFNQLRLSSKREHGSLASSSPRESHFHTSTDRLSFEADKFSLSANPEHFAAIYNVVTDLILYSDPLRKSRNSKVESLVFTRDFSNLGAVMDTVGQLQQHIRRLIGAAHEFQVHLDELDDAGRVQLFLQRAEAFRLASELSLVVEAFTRAQDSNGAKSSSKSVGLQLEARAAELTWHMLDKGDVPFAKFSVIGAEYSWVSKQDGSASNRMVIKDLRALNSSPEQIFAEIIAKADTGDASNNRLAQMDVFCAVLWNSLAPVGGISIIERFELHLHPVRLQLEHAVGRRILDYVFSTDRHNKPDEVDDGDAEHDKPRRDKPSPDVSRSSSSLNVPGLNAQANRSVDSFTAPRKSYASSTSLAATSSTGSDRALASSSASIRSTEHRLRKAVSADMLVSDAREEGLDADEMRRRAASNHTFIFVEISSTLLCLTYRSEKEDKSSLPNIYNITYKTPLIQYRSKTWSFLDLLDQLKRDMIRSVWQQKGQLLGQLLSKTHRRLPMADARSAAKQAVTASVRKRMKFVKSRTQHFGSGGASSAIPVGSVPLPEAPKPVDPRSQGLGDDLERPSRSSPYNALRRSSSFDPFDGELHDLPINGEFAQTPGGEHLPFDLGVVGLIYPEREDREGSYPRGGSRGSKETSSSEAAASTGRTSLGLGRGALTEEPESMGTYDGPAQPAYDGRSPSSTVQPSLPASQPSYVTRSSTSRQWTASTPSTSSFSERESSFAADVDSTFASMGSLSSTLPGKDASAFGRHRPVRRAGSSMGDEEKRRLLLGKSLD
ncbi:hypothetical protein JCM9279_006025 [Rhodotorula babjevae]